MWNQERGYSDKSRVKVSLLGSSDQYSKIDGVSILGRQDSRYIGPEAGEHLVPVWLRGMEGRVAEKV